MELTDWHLFACLFAYLIYFSVRSPWHYLDLEVPSSSGQELITNCKLRGRHYGLCAVPAVRG